VTCTGHPTVLIASADPIQRTALAELLPTGCLVLLAADADAALRCLAEADVTLMLLAATLPSLEGPPLLRRLKAGPLGADLQIILLTGEGEEAAEEAGLRLGALDSISWPLRPMVASARLQAHLRAAVQKRQLAALAIRDGPTGLAGRRQFEDALHRACRLAARTGETMGIALVDIDHYDAYACHHGRGAGEAALRQVAGLLQGIARRPQDLTAHHEGGLFTMLMLQTGHFARRLDQARQNIAALALPHAPSGPAAILTVSVGGVVARVPRDAFSSAAPLMLKHAEALLNRARDAGRNKVMTEALLVRS
jgi:diguanylate cyclase (GGDEF)-like protein